MKKLFVLPEGDDPYAPELDCARARVNGHTSVVSLGDLTVDYLLRHEIDVVISTGLPVEWYFVLRGMDVVAITLGDRERYYDLSDIVIDWRGGDPKHYFVGRDHSVCEDPTFEFAEIAELITKLEWDSDFFGFNVAFLSCMHLTDTIYWRIDRFIQDEEIRLVEYLCNCHDARSVRVAEAHGFHFTDIRLEFTRSIRNEAGAEPPEGLRFARAEERHIEELRRIAHGLYTDSRYHFDENFPSDRVVEFYKSWVEKGVKGEFDHECWSVFDGDVPVAFCTIRFTSTDTARIGVVGSDAGYRGKGLGKRLLHHVFAMLEEKGMTSLDVVTQGRNYAAQNLYQSVGFRTKNTQLWYHKWY